MIITEEGSFFSSVSQLILRWQRQRGDNVASPRRHLLCRMAALLLPDRSLAVLIQLGSEISIVDGLLSHVTVTLPLSLSRLVVRLVRLM